MSYLTTGEAARLCGVGINTIKRWVRMGHVSCIRTPGGHWRIPRKDFLQFMASMRSPEDRSEAGDIKRVLIIDDDPRSCEFVHGALACAVFDCEVICAHDGYSGLIRIGQIRPQLLVLDIMMPEINGLELLHRLRSRPELCDGMKILVYTGARDRQLVMHKIRAGPDALLLKPAGVDDFLHAAIPLLRPVVGGTAEAMRR